MSADLQPKLGAFGHGLFHLGRIPFRLMPEQVQGADQINGRILVPDHPHGGLGFGGRAQDDCANATANRLLLMILSILLISC